MLYITSLQGRILKAFLCPTLSPQLIIHNELFCQQAQLSTGDKSLHQVAIFHFCCSTFLSGILLQDINLLQKWMHGVLPALNFSKFTFQRTKGTWGFALRQVESDRTKGNGVKLKGKRFRLNVRKKNFTQKSARHWKKLTREDAEPVERFSLQQKAEVQRLEDLIEVCTADTCRELPQHNMRHPGNIADSGI